MSNSCTDQTVSHILGSFIEYLKTLDRKYDCLYEYACSFMQLTGGKFTPPDTVQNPSSVSGLEPYSLYVYDNTIYVYLRPITNLPVFEDCVASQAATVGVDLTDPANWADLAAYGPLALCWNILADKHDIVVADRLTKLEDFNDGHIPFDHATGKLRAILSLLKFSQDNLYRRQYFETSLKPVSRPDSRVSGQQLQL